MPYLDDWGCAGRGGCACGSCGNRLGERFLPEALEEEDAIGQVPVAQPSAFAARRLRARQGHIKGKIAERLISFLPEARRALSEARGRALREGIDPRSVKFTRNVKGVHHDGVDRQLTDGVIYGRTKTGKVRILNVFESKARSGLRDVAVRRGGDLGQIARDFERLRQLPLKIDNEYVQPSNVQVSRNRTAWTVFLPRGVKPTAGETREIRARSGFDLRTVELPLTNAQLEARAAAFVKRHPARPR
jgi:hypothetical protein